MHLAAELLALEKLHLQLGDAAVALLNTSLEDGHVLHLLAQGAIVLVVVGDAATGLDDAHLKLELLYLLLEFQFLGLHGRLSTGLGGGKVGADSIELGRRGDVLVGQHLQLDLGLAVLRLGGLQLLEFAQQLVVGAGQRLQLDLGARQLRLDRHLLQAERLNFLLRVAELLLEVGDVAVVLQLAAPRVVGAVLAVVQGAGRLPGVEAEGADLLLEAVVLLPELAGPVVVLLGLGLERLDLLLHLLLLPEPGVLLAPEPGLEGGLGDVEGHLLPLELVDPLLHLLDAGAHAGILDGVSAADAGLAEKRVGRGINVLDGELCGRQCNCIEVGDSERRK